MSTNDTPSRKPIPKRLRFEILRRDNHACRYCGATAPGVKLTVDHVIPVVLGGSDDPTNLVTACTECNGGKTSIHPDAATVADVSADAIRWARAMSFVAECEADERAEAAEQMECINAAWSRWTHSGGRPVPRPDDWGVTARRWLDLGLTEEDLVNAVSIAMNAKHVTAADTWRYFCGINWRTLTRRQEEARRLIELGVV